MNPEYDTGAGAAIEKARACLVGAEEFAALPLPEKIAAVGAERAMLGAGAAIEKARACLVGAEEFDALPLPEKIAAVGAERAALGAAVEAQGEAIEALRRMVRSGRGL